jgi:hypothetical protein
LDSLVQITELSSLLNEVAKISKLLKKVDISGQTSRADKVMREQGSSSVESMLKFAGAIIIMVILFLLLAIIRKINEGVKSHVF